MNGFPPPAPPRRAPKRASERRRRVAVIRRMRVTCSLRRRPPRDCALYPTDRATDKRSRAVVPEPQSGHSEFGQQASPSRTTAPRAAADRREVKTGSWGGDCSQRGLPRAGPPRADVHLPVSARSSPLPNPSSDRAAAVSLPRPRSVPDTPRSCWGPDRPVRTPVHSVLEMQSLLEERAARRLRTMHGHEVVDGHLETGAVGALHAAATGTPRLGACLGELCLALRQLRRVRR